MDRYVFCCCLNPREKSFGRRRISNERIPFLVIVASFFRPAKEQIVGPELAQIHNVPSMAIVVLMVAAVTQDGPVLAVTFSLERHPTPDPLARLRANAPVELTVQHAVRVLALTWFHSSVPSSSIGSRSTLATARWKPDVSPPLDSARS